MKLNIEEFLWSQKYRPKNINECILPKNIKTIFEGIINSKNIPNLLLCGQSGVGKTSAALALINELDYEYYFINGSLYGNIDTLRNEISEFASSVSFNGKRKVVLLDEADNLTNHTQLALRSFIEEYSSNCAFILTANYPNKIIEGIRESRCNKIEFVIPNDEKIDLMKQYIIKSIEILRNENIKFDQKIIAANVKNLFPDFRKIINELQISSNSGSVDIRILLNYNDNIKTLIKYLKEMNIFEIKKWVETNNVEISKLSEDLYFHLEKEINEKDISNLILILNEYDMKNALVINKTLNIEAMLVEIMLKIGFK